jgi:hypothetical protein
MRKWIALLLLAVFLPATAFAQTCATRCTVAPVLQQAAQEPAMEHDMSAMSEHCKTEKQAEACPFATVCDFANLFVLNLAPIQFTSAPPSVVPEFFPAGFVSVTYPPALRPPTV